MNNVIFICCDALSNYRMSLGGYEYNTCPTISKMSENSIYCANAITHSGPTQFALPSLFTSTLPLDCGGYDEGIKNRKNSIVAVLKEKGYNTGCFGFTPWTTPIDGYNHYDDSINNFDLKLLWVRNKIYYDYYNSLMIEKSIEMGEYLKTVAKILDKHFRLVLTYCKNELKSILNTNEKYHELYKYNYDNIYIETHKEYEKFKIDTVSYILNNIDDFINFYTFLKKCRSCFQANHLSFIEKLTFNTIKKEKAAKKKIRRFLSGSYIISQAIEWINTKKKNNEYFFSWIHLLDIHELNFTEGKYKLLNKLNVNRFLTEIGREDRINIIDYLKSRRQIDKSLLYDASIKYVDNNIKRLIKFLDANNILDDTLIVLFADHGSSLDFQGDNNYLATFYDKYVKVPLMFYNPLIDPVKIKYQCGLIDVAPTVLDMLGIEIPESYKGIPIYSEDVSKREYLIMENLSRGPCDLLRKPINIALRTDQYKLIFNESNGNNPGYTCKLFDIVSDPEENNDLSNSPLYESVLQNLIKIAQKRCCNIREQLNKS